jgi:transposase-like protein
MTLNAKSNPHEAIEQILSAGLDGLPSAIAILVNEAMIIERNRYLDADPYERTDSRVSYANGYKPRTLKTRSGMLSLQVPQTRDSLFYPSILDKGMRSERALKLSIAEMYFTGVATRKVKRIMEQMCGFEITSSEVSRCSFWTKSWDNGDLGVWAGIDTYI